MGAWLMRVPLASIGSHVETWRKAVRFCLGSGCPAGRYTYTRIYVVDTYYYLLLILFLFLFLTV